MSFIINNTSISSTLVSYLQKPIVFSIKGKTIKRGKLLLFRRSHFFLQLSIETSKKTKETFDVPCPFNIENYPEEELLYFDYRLDSLLVSKLPKIPNKVSSLYFNNILEMRVESID